MDNYLKVGVISNTHGIRGEVKVFPTTDDLKRFDSLEEVYLDTGKEMVTLKVQGVKYFKNLAILKFENIDNINDVEAYKGMDLFVTRQDAVELKEDEYFVCDIIGSRVISDEDLDLGELIDVFPTGSNDVFVVQDKNKKEVLIPNIKDCVLNIDLDKKIIKVHLLEGLV